VSSLPDEKKFRGDLFNVLIIVNVAITAIGTLSTAYLMLHVSPQTPATIYRSLLYLGPFVAIEALTAIAVMICITSAIIALSLNSSGIAVVVGGAFSAFFFVALFAHLTWFAVKAFPGTYLYWGNNPLLSILISRSSWDDAKRIGAELVSQSAFHLGVAATHDSGGASGEETSTPSEDGSGSHASLHMLVKRALPMAPEKRQTMVSKALFVEDLSVEMMQATLALQGGASVLFSALDLGDTGLSQLRRGERIAIITELSKMVTSVECIGVSN
jgi:hypothetical protein